MKKNLLQLLATIVFTALLFIAPFYSYISSDLPNDVRFIFLHWNDPPEKKYKLRFGATFTLLNHMAQHTPPDAIILMPPDSVLLDSTGKHQFHPYITEKTWASYFVYPRKLVYEKEKNTSKLYSKADYVAIVNGWGIDKLHYHLTTKVITAVVPINP